MDKTWDLSSVLRGKVLAALFATTAIFAGAHALAPSAASAERTDCTTEPQGCDGESGGGGDGGSDSSGSNNGGGTGFGGTSGQPSGSDWGTNGSSIPVEDGFDNPFAADPNVAAALNEPNLRSLDPAYVDRLFRQGIISPAVVQSALYSGDLSVLTADCYHLSSMIGSLDDRAGSLADVLDQIGNGPGAGPFQRSLSKTKERKHNRSVEYRALSCGAVISMDGRD